MNPLKKLLGQTATYGLSSILGRTLNFLLVPLYTTVFTDAADYGIVSQLYALVAFLMVILTFGMETAYFRFLQQESDKATVFRTSFLTVIGINCLFFLGLFFFSGSIAELLLLADHTEYIVLLAAIVCIDAISSMPLAKLRAEEKAKQFASIQLISIGLNIGLNLFFLLVLFDPSRPEDGVLFILIANLISSIAKPILLYKDFQYLEWRINWKLCWEMSKYGIPIVVAGFAGIVNETIDRIMLKQILHDQENMTVKLADAQVGIYSACYKLAMFVTILLQAYRYAAEPFFFSQSKNEDRNKLYVKLMNYFVAAISVVFLLVALNLDIFKYFISNETYWEGLEVVPILLIANVFFGIYLNQSIWYKLSNQTKFGAYIALGGAAITIAINFVFIPQYGYMASAWATLIVYGLQMIASYVLGQKYYPIKYNLRKFGLYLGASILLFLLASSLPLESGSFLKFLINNGLIVVFIALVLFVEGISIRGIWKKV